MGVKEYDGTTTHYGFVSIIFYFFHLLQMTFHLHFLCNRRIVTHYSVLSTILSMEQTDRNMLSLIPFLGTLTAERGISVSLSPSIPLKPLAMVVGFFLGGGRGCNPR